MSHALNIKKVIMNEYSEENLLKAEKIVSDNKDYIKEKDLLNRIQMFRLYKFAKKWIKSNKL
tara:strand:- start:632 stop:817 length:186 start_codon:yes stop_codon:yes gene_type:complete